MSEMERKLEKTIADLEKEKLKTIADLEKEKLKTIADLEREKTELEREKKHDKQISDLRVHHLEDKLKTASLEVFKQCSVYSVRAAVESIVAIQQPGPIGTSKKIMNEFARNDTLRLKYDELCKMFNCVNNSSKIPENIYHSLSSQIHGGGMPIRCFISDKTLSPAEWAFVIALFKVYLPPESFVVYDQQNNEITDKI